MAVSLRAMTYGVIASAALATSVMAGPLGWFGDSDAGEGPPSEQQAQTQVALEPLAPPLGPLDQPPWVEGQPPVWQPQPVAHAPAHSGCGCPSCAAGGGPHFYPGAEQLPMFAPTQVESAEFSLLPEIGEEWFGRPLTAGAFAGVLLGDELIASELELKPGLFTGVRFGADYDRRWAWETRIAYANPEVVNLQGPELSRDADLYLAESSLLYWRHYGRRLRPYATAGMGFAYLDTTDHLGRELRELIPTIPVGVGALYRLDESLVLHVDVHDSIMLGQQVDLELMHNLTLAGGVEFRFGGSPNKYYPWNPAKN